MPYPLYMSEGAKGVFTLRKVQNFSPFQGSEYSLGHVRIFKIYTINLLRYKLAYAIPIVYVGRW